MIDWIFSWWGELNLAEQIFYAIAWLSLAGVLLQAILAMIGFGFEGLLDIFSIDADVGGSGGGLFSGQTICGFLLGFGWGGVIAIESGASTLLATIVGLGAGTGVMFLVFLLLRAMLSLQSDGNLKYEEAIGKEATVYVTLPGDDQDGGGQIEMMLGGRVITAHARKRTPGAVKPGKRVRIVKLIGASSFEVEEV